MRLAAFAMLIALLLGAAPSVRADETGIERRCRPSEALFDTAEQAVASLAAAVESLPEDASSAEPSLSRLDAVYEHPCFLLAREVSPRPRPTTARAFKRWWRDGGEEWLRSYLEEGWREKGAPASIVLPPTPRTDIARGPDVPAAIAALVCGGGDEACERRSRAFALRAETHFDGIEYGTTFGRWTETRPDVDRARASCARELGKRRSAEAYREFRACLDRELREHPMLPVGTVKVPSTGFFVIEGRRGHHTFCDELRAYSLENGDAFVAKSCSGLVLRADGSVDHDATFEQRSLETERGHVDVGLIRELAWMLAMLPTVETGRRRAARVELPRGLEPRLPSEQGIRTATFGSFLGSSDQSLQAWHLAGGDDALSGDLVWPYGNTALDDYTVDLLKVAEASFQPGCPRVAPGREELLPPSRERAGRHRDRRTPELLAMVDALVALEPKTCRNASP